MLAVAAVRLQEGRLTVVSEAAMDLDLMGVATAEAVSVAEAEAVTAAMFMDRLTQRFGEHTPSASS